MIIFLPLRLNTIVVFIFLPLRLKLLLCSYSSCQALVQLLCSYSYCCFLQNNIKNVLKIFCLMMSEHLGHNSTALVRRYFDKCWDSINDIVSMEQFLGI